jgi:hypothetical protein
VWLAASLREISFVIYLNFLPSFTRFRSTSPPLIQWMVPILLVMGIYLAIWTVAEPPTAEDVSTHVYNID